MIYFIDDDVGQTRAFRLALQISGYEVEAIDNADDGFQKLRRMTSEDRAIVDVMLGTKDHRVSAFPRTETDDFLRTGVVLVRKILEERGESISTQLVLFTGMGGRILNDIEKDAKKMNIRLLKKSDCASPKKFIDKLVEIGFIDQQKR